RPVALEELDGVMAHALTGGRVAVPVMDDAAAVGDTADGHVIEAEAIEEGGHRTDHVRGPQDVAAEVEDDGGRLRIGLGRQAPAPLVRRGHEVVQDLHLAEVLAVVERHGGSLSPYSGRGSTRMPASVDRSTRSTVPGAPA